jgi:hypothetical protein
MAILNSKFDILRGWPDGSAIAEDFTISEIASDAAAAGDNVFRSGHFVALGVEHDLTDANYTCASDANKLNSDGSLALGLVIEGQEDYSSRMSKTVTTLIAGGYVVRLHLEASQAGFQGKVDGGVDQFRATASCVKADNTVGSATMKAGARVVVFNGLVEPLDANHADPKAIGGHTPEAITAIGTCLRYDSSDNTCDILVH